MQSGLLLQTFTRSHQSTFWRGVSAKETNPSVSGPKLHYDMCRIFPELSKTKISHSWFGTVAYTFDELAHTGCHDGMFYSMGYCGSGVSMASYLGMRLGQKVIGAKEGITPFDDLPFPLDRFMVETHGFYRLSFLGIAGETKRIWRNIQIWKLLTPKFFLKFG